MCKERKCINCGNIITKINRSQYPDKFCSYKCYEVWERFHRTPNCKCSVCGRELYMKPYRLKRLKWERITCSKECSNELRKEKLKGTGNHQYGLKGDKNSSFKNRLIKCQGYYYEYCPDHPKAGRSGRIRQHRAVVERNFSSYNEEYFEIINGKPVLKDEYDVHHINGIKTDNRPENLQVLTRSEHSKLHISRCEITRDSNSGRIIGVNKISGNAGKD